MSFITSVSHLSKLRVPVRFIARGGSNDVACFFAPSYELIPWAAIMRAKDYVRVLVGPFSEEEQQQACADDSLLSVFGANRHTPDCTIAEVICHIWHRLPRQIDGDDFKKTPMEGTARLLHLCSLIDRVLDAGLSKQKPVATQIIVTKEVTVQARARAASDDALELPTVTCVGTTGSDFAAERSAECFCGEETTTLPCCADLLPLPSDNLLGDYWSMARYDDISSQYTTRPSSAGIEVCTLTGSDCAERSAVCFCGDETTNLPCRADLLPLASDDLLDEYRGIASYDDTSSQCATRPSTAVTNVSTLVGSGIEKENKEPLQASQGRVTGCTDDLDELRLKWKSKGGMIVLEEVPARSRWHFRNWMKLICFG